MAAILLAAPLLLPSEGFAVVNDAVGWKTGAPPDGRVGQAYFFWMKNNYGKASEGGGPMDWKFESGTLPPGLALWGQKQGRADGIELKGTPTTAGSYTFTFIAHAYYGSWFRSTYTIVILPPPEPPVIRLRELATNGVGSFGFLLSAASAASTTITVTEAGLAVDSPSVFTGTARVAARIQQSSVPRGWPANPASVSCIDSNAAANGNSSGNLAVLSGNTATIPAAAMLDDARILCTFTNTALNPPTVALGKLTRGGAGKFDFGLTRLSPDTDSVTTAVADVAVASSTVHQGLVGVAATIREARAPANWLANPTSVACIDTNGAASGNGSGNLANLVGDTATLPASTMAVQARIVCTFTNTARKEPTVTLAELATNGTGTFKFTLTDAASPVEVVVDVTAANVVATSTYVHRGMAGRSVTVLQKVPVGWPIYPVAMSCTDRNAAASGNGTGNLATLVGSTATIPATAMAYDADILCTFTNTARTNLGAQKEGPDTVPAGQELSYLVKVTNQGALTSGTTIVVRDNLPPIGQAFAVAPLAGVSSVDCGALPSRLGESLRCILVLPSGIAQGQTRFFTMQVRAPDAPVGTPLTNTATVDPEGGEPPPAPSPTLRAARSGASPASCISPACSMVTTIVVAPEPVVRKTFTPAALVPGARSLLTITLSNTMADQPMEGLGFTDHYPAGLVNAPGAVPGTTCGSGVVDLPDGSSLRLSAGGIAAAGSCTVTVPVTAAAVGSYTNILPAGAVTAPLGQPTTIAAAASLAVRPQPQLRLQVRTVGGVGGPFSFEQTNLAATPPGTVTMAVGEPTPAAPAAIAVLDTGSAVTLTETSFTDFVPTGGECRDANAATTGNPAVFGSLYGNMLTIAAAQLLPGADIGCVFTNTARSSLVGIAGRLFNDVGSAGGTANDGVANGQEAGMAGLGVVLSDCNGLVHDRSTSDGGGFYRLRLPADLAAGAGLCVDAAKVFGRQSTGASAAGSPLAAGSAVAVAGTAFTYTRDATTDRIAFTWPGSQQPAMSALDFGSVPPNSFLLSGLKNGTPGSTVTYGHLFKAATAGSVQFSVSRSTSSPPQSGWSELIYSDPACSGSVQPAGVRLYPPAVDQRLEAGQSICIVVQESVPVQALPGSHNTAQVQAFFSYSNSASALSASYQVEDLTSVSGNALNLRKEVRNVSQGTGFAVANQARPGETLEYRITYSNIAASPIGNLVIHDATPAYTSFVSAQADSTPAELSACAKTTPASALAADCAASQGSGGHGPLQWGFTGSLQPGSSGSVLYRVLID
ncbi:DUF11 domain-containing protein [Xylophilus rhododendri]|uniref:DUF11 domain-containing protein n=1 Tax=Xylophilus rhododendri TaxID=2697032 RepID=A0A857J1M2_9BURK|nr:DUF11 domain-containing protein [Xylophilus rhododendri]QHI97606.1 DUF11 domain-containing protein [Xylophilus rhododendri]